MRRALADPPAPSQLIHEIKAPAADCLGLIATPGDEAPTVVDDLAAQPSDGFGVDQHHHVLTAAVDHAVGHEL